MCTTYLHIDFMLHAQSQRIRRALSRHGCRRVTARRDGGAAAAPAAACANNFERLLRSLARCLTREGDGSGCGVDDPDAAAPETVISLAAAAPPAVRAVKSTPAVWGGREESTNSTASTQPDTLS